MSYTVLARRYRSNSFDDVVGQDAVAKTLKNAIAADRVAHAYLFTGTRGVGKTTMARILAKALNCLAADSPTTTPCCQCESCLAIAEGNDIDVVEIDAASNTGVEHIRELRQNAIYRPARARFKIYIIDEVHMLSVSAFNALLKTLEEPPEHVKFILATTEPNKILPTIMSRCQRFDFRNIQLDDIAGQLDHVLAGEGIEAEAIVVRRVARLANGSMRDALSLLDQLLSMGNTKITSDMLSNLLGTPRSQRILELVGAIAEGDLGRCLRQVDQALTEGLGLEQLAQALQQHFRDLMVLRSCGPQTELVDIDEGPIRDQAVEQSKLFDDATLVYYITVMEELRRSLKASGSTRPLFEAAVVRLTATERFSDTKVLLRQLQSLLSANPGSVPAAASAPTARTTPANPSGNRTGLANATRTAAAPVRSATGAAPTEPATAPAPERPNQPGNTQGGLEIPPQITLNFLQQNWPRILTAIQQKTGPHMQMYLTPWQPAGWDKDTLSLSLAGQSGGLGKMLADRPQTVAELEKAFSAVLATAVKINLLKGTAPSADPPPSPRSKAPGAKPSQKEIDAAMADAQIKNVQKILGGKVRHIERLPDPPSHSPESETSSENET